MIATNSELRSRVGDQTDGLVFPTKSVLLVCWSNVCRSPVAQSILEKYLRFNRIDSLVDVDTAGVSLDETPPRPSFSMRWAAFRRGYRIAWHPRIVSRTDLIKFDLVIAMDQQNLNALKTFHKNPNATIRLLSDFLPSHMPREVPDPMNRPLNVCDKVIDMIELACPGIVRYLIEGSEGSRARTA